MNRDKVRVGVIGATGYSGVELMRILSQHPHVVITYVAGNHHEERALSLEHPYLPGFSNLTMETYQPEIAIERCDALFVALPSGRSGEIAGELWRAGKVVIDLSGDLRLPGALYEQWYAHPAVRQELVDHAVYGLTEWRRDLVRQATLVANPGCYATAVLLALLPLYAANLVPPEQPLIVDAKSGVSGAGRKATAASMLAELGENFYAYKVGQHQHTPEIESQLAQAGFRGRLLLTTQLLPCTRGIFVSAYIQPQSPIDDADVQAAFLNRYRDEPFITVHAPGEYPQLKHVRGSNRCHIGYRMDARTGVLQVFSVLDNLQKGAAGQAVQNFNVMHGFAEGEALAGLPVYP
ncbi:N-acetyl-gamma-glutamyl-phosphate reductase [Alicyclobacillus kakegawensis]|uniref:N-acetyl-gamma-glutamyl-phosphate reductase n=1 Tax=Alicyclobacillus kakegawensis TaxID=392012 RepID=UPI0008326B29|nr:N-acetyl-gamma-glutamyl-phosphate reductase [Alicyclobacillus kakegawensis]